MEQGVHQQKLNFVNPSLGCEGTRIGIPKLSSLLGSILRVSSPFDQNFGRPWVFSGFSTHSWWSWISMSRFIYRNLIGLDQYSKGFHAPKNKHKIWLEKCVFWPTAKSLSGTANPLQIQPYWTPMLQDMRLERSGRPSRFQEEKELQQFLEEYLDIIQYMKPISQYNIWIYTCSSLASHLAQIAVFKRQKFFGRKSCCSPTFGNVSKVGSLVIGQLRNFL